MHINRVIRMQAKRFKQISPQVMKVFGLCVTLLWVANVHAQRTSTTVIGQDAAAQDPDTFKIYAGYALQTDSNLFRLPDGADTAAFIGRSSGSEQIGVTTLGLRLNKPYSLQRFEIDANMVDYRYQNFNYLGFTATNLAAAWRWSVTPRLRGNVIYARTEAPTSYLDYQGFQQRNQSTDTLRRFDAGYDIDGTWRVLAGVAQAEQVNLLPVVALGDTSNASADVGLQYLFGSGSSVTYALKSADGKFLNRPLQQATLLDDGYRQIDHEARFHWVIKGKTTADATAAFIARTHPHFAQRDFNGFNTSVNVNLGLTGKSALGASWVRELASYQTQNSNYSQTDRISLEPVWQVSTKVAVRLRYELAKRSFFGSPLGLAALGRIDTTQDASIALDWQPYERVSLGVSLQNSRRQSNLAGLDYKANLAMLLAKVSY